ncbi:Ig-like domain repeat protein [Microbacteriaceae bacterium K1510]|nr:Ig-like domain repeat protein [Microbacteriaceae bacterium K1510]
MSADRRGLATRLIVICGALLAVALFSVRPAQAQNATATANMSFTPATISIGGTSTLNFTIQINPAGGGGDTTATNLSFTDALPSGLVVATPSGLNIPNNSGPGCNGATVTATAGSSTISFSDVVLNGILSNCVFSVNVTATTAGSKTNAVTMSTFGGNNTSNATLTVNAVTSATTLTSSLNPSALGQAVTFTATVSGTTPTGTVTFKDGATTLGTGTLNGAGQTTFATSSLTVGAHSITAVYSGDANNAASTSAALTQAVGTALDSLKLKALQNQVAPMVAQSSGAAISGAIDNAISDAFGDGGTPISAGPNGMTINFAAEPRSEVRRRADDAFSALGYAGNPTKAPPRHTPVEREWSLWLDVRGTGWNRNNTSADLKGDQINVTAGIGRKLTPDLLVGLVAGYENFKYDSASLTGTMKGNGGTIGAYAAWRLLPTLRWDAAFAWSDVSYDGSAGTAHGTFTGHRWLASTGLTGSYRVAAFVVEPSAKVYALWEREGEWTDSLGTLQAARSFSTGRVATGGKVIYPWMLGDGARLSPYAGLYADWRFGSDDAVPAGQPLVGIGNGWSARATGGLAYTTAGGASLSLGGEYGGLGADYKVWTAAARGTLPF